MTEEQENAVRQFVDQYVTREHRAGRETQALCSFTRDFFERFSAPEIPRVLAQWDLPKHVRRSPYKRVVVTSEGVRPPSSHKEAS